MKFLYSWRSGALVKGQISRQKIRRKSEGRKRDSSLAQKCYLCLSDSSKVFRWRSSSPSSGGSPPPLQPSWGLPSTPPLPPPPPPPPRCRRRSSIAPPARFPLGALTAPPLCPRVGGGKRTARASEPPAAPMPSLNSSTRRRMARPLTYGSNAPASRFDEKQGRNGFHRARRRAVAP